jgi:hypothetical protein
MPCWVVFYQIVGVILLILLCVFGDRRHIAARKMRNQFEIDRDTEPAWNESQCPMWIWGLWLMTIAMVLPTVGRFGLDALRHGETGSVIVILAIPMGIWLLLMLFSGIHVRVDSQNLRIYLGIFRIRIFSITLERVARAEVMEFRALRDFGGWGIRYGRGPDRHPMWSFFMSGGSGVIITTCDGKKYLIGSDNPEQLTKVIRSRLPEWSAGME